MFSKTLKVLEKYEKHRNKRIFKHYSKKALGRDWFFLYAPIVARVPVSKLAHSVWTKLEFREWVNFVVKFAAVTVSFCAQTIYRVWLVGLWFDVAFYFLTHIRYWFQNGKYRSTSCCNYLGVVIRESNPTDVQVQSSKFIQSLKSISLRSLWDLGREKS